MHSIQGRKGAIGWQNHELAIEHTETAHKKDGVIIQSTLSRYNAVKREYL